jgi:hypothetical protein
MIAEITSPGVNCAIVRLLGVANQVERHTICGPELERRITERAMQEAAE